MQRVGEWIEVLSGTRFYPFDPRAGEMVLRDMTHTISREPRWGCHTETFYTVGMHSVQAAWMSRAMNMGPFVEFLALTHDFPESYLRDLPRPIKRMLPEYQEADERILNVLWHEYFGLRSPTEKELQMLRYVDDSLCHAEAIALGINKTGWVEKTKFYEMIAGPFVWKSTILDSDIRDTLEAMVGNILRELGPEDVGPGVYQQQTKGA